MGCSAIFLVTLSFIVRTYALSPPANSLSEANAEFSLGLLRNSGPSNENVFFSPWSISTCLGMLYTGAAGETKNQINKFVYAGLPESKVYSDIKSSLDETSNLASGYSLNAANRIYTYNEAHLSSIAKQKLTQNFKSDFVIVNFADSEPTRQMINNWVEEITRQKINELLPRGSITGDAKMVLVNAVYFKGDWWVTFNQTQTRDKLFSSNANNQFNIPMMHAQHNNFHYFQDAHTKVLGIPFKNETMMMYFVLPTQRFGLNRVVQEMSGKELLEVFNEAKRVDDVEVEIPKFNMKKGFPLTEALVKLNVTDMFQQNKANFSAFFSPGSAAPNMFVSGAFHKAAIEVNEEGSIAAAATAFVASTRSLSPPRPHPVFRANEPFLFSIVHRSSKNILFFGRFSDNKFT